MGGACYGCGQLSAGTNAPAQNRTCGQQRATAMGCTVTDWKDLGETAIDVTGRGVVQVLSAALQEAVAIGTAEPATDSGRSIRIRSEQDTVADLFADLVETLFDEAIGMNVRIASVEIEGMVRSDRAMIVWGSLRIGNGSPSDTRTLELIEAPVIEEIEGELRIRARMRRRISA